MQSAGDHRLDAGSLGDGVDQATAFGWLVEGVGALGEHASQYGVPLLYEPLNRYETNVVNTVESGLKLIKSLSSPNVKLLCDLFHMNIEEVDIAAALRVGGAAVGHLHFVDSNRRPAGWPSRLRPDCEGVDRHRFRRLRLRRSMPYPDAAARRATDHRRVPSLVPRLIFMLKHLLIHPKINEVIGRAGHHAKILIADGNYPASSKKGPNAEQVSLNLMPGVVAVQQALLLCGGARSMRQHDDVRDDGALRAGERSAGVGRVSPGDRGVGVEAGVDADREVGVLDAVATPDHVLTVQTADQQRFANILLSIACGWIDNFTESPPSGKTIQHSPDRLITVGPLSNVRIDRHRNPARLEHVRRHAQHSKGWLHVVPFQGGSDILPTRKGVLLQLADGSHHFLLHIQETLHAELFGVFLRLQLGQSHLGVPGVIET